MTSMNMFAALNDSDSDDEPKQVVAKAPAPAAKPERKPERKPRAQAREGNDRPQRAERESGPYGGEDKISNPAADRERQGKGKGERRSGGKGKDGKGTRGDSGREFPRRSATGRGRENPKSGGGKFNWGKDGAEGAAEPTAEGAVASEGAAAEAAEPVVVEEEEPETMSIEEYEKLQAEKLNALNLNKYEERKVEADEDVVAIVRSADTETELALSFDGRKKKKNHGRKGAKEGYKQADTVINMKYVDENADAGKGAKGGKGDRRKGGGKGERSSKGGAPTAAASAPKASIDLSNDNAFPTLGA
eukprot:TRINITY_DN194_c0_g1_i4.p2 TRINITY_DN194_c0_g1~~TRINITY_DN194_c0_g1_i4.p2  ORF type:complete len:304 (-),score=99.85 TRINITY_DN194_c0_g1_i4:325-1236(-)